MNPRLVLWVGAGVAAALFGAALADRTRTRARLAQVRVAHVDVLKSSLPEDAPLQPGIYWSLGPGTEAWPPHLFRFSALDLVRWADAAGLAVVAADDLSRLMTVRPTEVAGWRAAGLAPVPRGL